MSKLRNWFVLALWTIATISFSGCDAGGPSVPADFKPDGKSDPGLSSPNAEGGGGGGAAKKKTAGAIGITDKPE